MIVLNDEGLLAQLRDSREKICFPIVNRGKLWYNTLTKEQLSELKAWYRAWLDVTTTLNIPVTPDWVNNKVSEEIKVW